MTESEESDGSEATTQLGFQSRAHKLATLFIMTAGSANATRFPEMSIAHGGVPFMLAYLTLLCAVVMPVMHLESSLAQFSEDGNRGIFGAVPLFIGLGYTMSLCAVVHILGDSVLLSQHLLHLVSWLRNLSWTGCPGGEMVASDRACYAAPAPLCSNVRSRMAELFRREQLDQGLPISGDDGLVVVVPVRDYHDEAAGCIPGVYDPVHQSQPRRAGASWDAGSFDEIRMQPLLSLAAVWVLVFAFARHGLCNAKRFFYAMVFLHLVTTAILLVRGASLPGSLDGLGMFFYADWGSVVDVQMWTNALYVCLESVGVTGSVYLGVARLNDFKNAYQDDVIFVLAADTASKGLRTVITFMLLGHLSASIGVDAHMLVDPESDHEVSIMPQAISAVPWHQFWGQVHSLWLISTVLPKFFMVPDILLELLAASHPLVVANRTLVHFFLCALLVTASTLVCSPGGATMASIFVHNHDRDLRFLVLFLESVVVLQFCGVHRLNIISAMMTGRECNFFVKVCWTSIIPITVICIFCAEGAVGYNGPSFHYPTWTYAITAWLYLVQLSCIPVFAIVFMKETGLNIRDCLSPLPTWVPAAWDQAMVYRQLMVIEGMDTEARQEPLKGPRPKAKGGRRVAAKKSESSSSSSDVLGNPDLFVASRTIMSPSSPSSPCTPRNQADKPGPGMVHDSGTVHVSRRLSSIRRSMMRPKPPAVGDGASEATKSSRPVAASTGTSSHEPTDVQPHKTGLDRDASPFVGPCLPEAAVSVDSQMDVAALPVPEPQLELAAPCIPEMVENGKASGRVQDVANVPQNVQAKQSRKEIRDQKAASKSKLSTKSSAAEDSAVKPDLKEGAVSQGSGASAKNLAGAQGQRVMGLKTTAEEDAPAKPDSGNAAACLQEEPKAVLKRLKEEVLRRKHRQHRKHGKAAPHPAEVSAEPHDVARAAGAVSPESDPACQPGVVRVPSMSTIDKTSAFRSLLRNLLLRPEERAGLPQRGRAPLDERTPKKSIAERSPWFSLDRLRAAPSAGLGLQEVTSATTMPGQRFHTPQPKVAGSRGSASFGVLKGSASPGPGQSTVIEHQPKASIPSQDAKRDARRLLKAENAEHKVVSSFQERHARRKSMPSIPSSLKKASGSQAELHASRLQRTRAAASGTGRQSPISVSTRSKRSKSERSARNVGRESKKANNDQQNNEHKDVRPKHNRSET